MKNRYDPLLPLSIAAVASKTIHIRTAVANRVHRLTMVVANSFWHLQKPSEGRFILGLGHLGTGTANEITLSKSLFRETVGTVLNMREYIAALRGIFSHRT